MYSSWEEPGISKTVIRRTLANDKQGIHTILTQHLEILEEEATWTFFHDEERGIVGSWRDWDSEWNMLTVNYNENPTEEERRAFLEKIRVSVEKDAARIRAQRDQ